MSKEPRYTLIGAFVVGACLIVVAALLFLGSDNLFKPTKKFVAYFSGSVKGLSVGAPVSFRGAQVGTVKSVNIVYNSKGDQLLLPVTFEIDPSSISGLAFQSKDLAEAKNAPLMERLIGQGLRATLSVESLVTGQLYIALDFFPNSPVRLVGEDFGYPEVPTTESGLDKIKSKIEELPVEELSNQAMHLLQQLNSFMEKGNAQEVLTDLRGLIAEANKTLAKVDQKGDLIATDIDELSKAAEKALTRADGAMKALEGTIQPDSAPMQDVSATLKEAAAAARSLRQFTDYLQTHPETLLRGRQ